MSPAFQNPIVEEDAPEEWDAWDPMLEDYQSTKNTLRLDPDKEPECTVTGQMVTSKLGGKDVCEHYLKYGSCADGTYCDRLHVTPKARNQLWTFAQNYELNKDRTCLNYTYLSPSELEPNDQALILVSVTHIRSPSDFVFIAPYDQMDCSNFNEEELNFYLDRVHHSSTYKTKLQKCHEQLSALFDHDYRLDDVQDDIHLSQIVACKLNDGRFCRAMVIGLEDFSNEQFDYKLFLIDVGIVVERPRELIYDIRANCLSEPPMATDARLDVKPTKGNVSWPQDVLDKFTDKLGKKKYMLCRLIGYDSQSRAFIVDLYDAKSKLSLTERMIECGLADPASSRRDQRDLLSFWESY